MKAHADRTGRGAAFHIREAIEDLCIAEQELTERRRSGERPLSLDELDAALGQEN